MTYDLGHMVVLTLEGILDPFLFSLTAAMVMVAGFSRWLSVFWEHTEQAQTNWECCAAATRVRTREKAQGSCGIKATVSVYRALPLHQILVLTAPCKYTVYAARILVSSLQVLQLMMLASIHLMPHLSRVGFLQVLYVRNYADHYYSSVA